MSLATLPSEAPGPLAHVRWLADFWRHRTLRGPAPAWHGQGERVLLDTLGLGLEQALTWLMRQRPDYPAFEAWVIQTAGIPDPETVARYHAWLDGVPPPAATRARLDAIDAMPPALDDAELERWETDGYAILRAAITRDEAAAAAALLWARIGADPGDPDSWYGLSTQGIMVQHFQGAPLEAARRSARVHKAFAQLWGIADLWMLVDRLSFNPPERPQRPFQGPHLHWDVSLARPIPFATQGILYLTDTSPDQGALRLVPGFHRRLDAWLDGPGARDPRAVDLSAEAKAIGANAGDLIIWRHDLPHGASPNRADRPRLAQYVNMYAPDLEAHAEWR